MKSKNNFHLVDWNSKLTSQHTHSTQTCTTKTSIWNIPFLSFPSFTYSLTDFPFCVDGGFEMQKQKTFSYIINCFLAEKFAQQFNALFLDDIVQYNIWQVFVHSFILHDRIKSLNKTNIFKFNLYLELHFCSFTFDFWNCMN